MKRKIYNKVIFQIFMERKDTQSINGINQILSQDSISRDLVSLEDINLLIKSGWRLYSWGGNGIRFSKEKYEPHAGFYIGRGKEGYNLQIQYVSIEPIRGCLRKGETENFFKARNIDFQERGQLRTDDLPLSRTLQLSSNFEDSFFDLLWFSPTHD